MSAQGETTALDSGGPLPNIPGYELLDLIGRGGMGVVYRARDLRLNREVAVKLLSERYTADSSAAERFKTEAQITGQLQHPGIPAVHELGTLPDGRPFLAMKLVKGRTLQEELETQIPPINAEDSLRDNPRNLRLIPSFLAIFEQICHAVGYAHAHRVIHRDLKPANIMVGAFGEVQVMDWGLAKVLDTSPDCKGGSSSEDPYSTAALVTGIDTPEHSSATRTGSVLGTPAYMPPEQAAGQVRDLDPRSDVFGLGAIFCQILTGRPPFEGKDANDVRVKAVRGELQDALARLDKCGAEPEIVALCKKCLAFQQEDRPADGQAVAEAVANIRNQAEARARQAELDRAQAMVREAEQRKRRRVWIGLAATLLLGVLGLVAGLVFVLNLNRRLDEANSSLQTALSNETAALTLAEGRKKLADANSREALEAVKAQVIDLNNELKNRTGTRTLREKLLKNAKERLQKLVERTSQRDAVDHITFWAHINLGNVYLDVDLKPSLARVEYEKAHEIAQQRVAADPSDAHAQRDLFISLSMLGDVTRQASQIARALEYHRQAFDIGKKLAVADPSDVEAQRDLAISCEKLGDVTMTAGQPVRALEYFTQGLDIRKKLAAADPSDARAQRNLSTSLERVGKVMEHLGKHANAKNWYEQMYAIKKGLADQDPTDGLAQRELSVALGHLGDLTLQAGQTPKALEYYTQVLDIRKKLAAADPSDASAQRDLAISYDGLGDVTLKAGRVAKALEHYTLAFEIAKNLAAGDSTNANAQTDLMVSLRKLWTIAKEQGEYSVALKRLRECRIIAVKLHEQGKLHGKFQGAVHLVEDDIATCELLLKLQPGLIEDPAWPLLWGWPRF